MKEIIKNYERMNLFNQYNERTNPFSFITTKIDITNAYNYSRKHHHLHALLMYVFVKSMNKIDNFKYMVEENQIIKYDILNPNYTVSLDNGDVCFIEFDMDDNYENYLNNFLKSKEIFKENQTATIVSTNDRGSVWLSCLPWFKFTGVIPPFEPTLPIPQLIWDKVEIVDNHAYINLMIMAHHGFVDGSHIAKLIEYINQELDNIKEC